MTTLELVSGVGEFYRANWREPPLDEMFPQQASAPGETSSGRQEPDFHYPSSWDDDGDDREDADEPGEAMMASPAALQAVDMSPTKLSLDLGCTKAMGSRAAVNHFCQYIDSQGHNTYLWCEIKPTTS